eukprot:c20760_g1_i1 orf=349-2427(-)
MERSETSFIPGWLKGTAGGGVSATHSNSDDRGFSRTKVTQQLLAVNNNLDSPRKSISSSKSFSSTSRRSHNNGSLERPASERDHFGGLVRSKSGLNRNSSIRNHSKLNLEQNGYNSWIDGEYGHEADRESYAKKKEWLSGMVPDGRDKDKEFGDIAMRQLYPAGLAGKYDGVAKLKRSQSMGLSASGKVMEVVSTVPSANGNSAINSQKTVFEHNFPTLGDDKQSSPRSSSITSPRPSISNPHLVWQGNSRSDLSRASSPGLTGGFANPHSTVPASISAGSDFWSSALADVPTSNGNIPSSSLTANAASLASYSQTSTSLVGPVTSAAPLNMAEALTQNPPRVRTPPQSSLESQRLEELALRQSRQLIPMTPSLPKTMSLVDKTKSKSMRTVDGTTTSLIKSQLSSSQKSVTPSKPDTLKPSQGKLLLLKSGKDGGTVVTPQVATQGNTAASAGSTTLGQRKQPYERRVLALQGTADGMRTKDSALLPDDKRIALHAQNRSDFFNTLRKKAAGNGNNVNALTCEAKTDSMSPRDTALAIEVAPVDMEPEAKENGVCDGLHCTQSSLKIESNGDAAISSGNGLAIGVSKAESGHSSLPRDLEEEEAAFMRSLGWEENEEGSELTEEEINAFYQMMEQKKLLKGKSSGNSRAELVVGSVGSVSSGLSSSDSETEEAPSFLLRTVVSNSTDYVRR